MKIGILGSGGVAKALAAGFISSKHDVMVGSRSPEKLADWPDEIGGGLKTGTFEETAAFGELIVLAVKGTAAEALTKQLAGSLTGKTVIDTTNPIAESGPVNGVISFFTSLDRSLMEMLQAAAPEANFVKAFNSIGAAHMVQPGFESKPTMFICGNDGGAKATTSEILDQFGWEVRDMGAVEAARAIEPLCILWCIPGFLENKWDHAFKLLDK